MTKHYRVGADYLTGTADNDPVPPGGILCPAPVHGRQKWNGTAWADDPAVEDANAEARAENRLDPLALALVDILWELKTNPAQFTDKADLRQKLKQRIKARLA